MDNFIKHIAQFIREYYPSYQHLTVVLPSRRAMKYIQQELFELHQGPFFSPKFETIDGFAKSFVDEQTVDSVDLLFRFYRIYQGLGHHEDFETFLNWAPMLIADCNEIDRYLIDPKQLFKNLRDIKEIENWSFEEGKKLSDSQRQFLEFWEQLKDYYEEINADLNREKLAYGGAVFRKALINLDERLEVLYPNQSFLFAGFNALSEAEIQLIQRLVKKGNTQVVAEADRFFLKNFSHEAGIFIRQTKARIPEMKIFETNRLGQDAKEIDLISCAQSGSMLKVTQDILSKMSAEELSKTVLLLADESLIVPAIKHIPKAVGKANITLGLPLKLTSLRPWVELIFEFQNNFAYFRTKSLYHKTLISFFRHPFLGSIMTEEDLKLFAKEEAAIVAKNKIFMKLPEKLFSEKMRQLLHLVLEPWEQDFKAAIERILEINRLIFESLDVEKDLIERSALFHFHESIKHLNQIFHQAHLPEMTLRSFEKFFNLRWMKDAVAYYGNPIEGLQVMGLLETRMLSFENLIVVGLNEGAMPPKNVVNSLIPMDLRRYFGLPLPNEKEALFAHHFYRLLIDAKRIWIMHSTNQGDDISLAEPSRYIKQIELELARQNPNISLKYSNFNLVVNSPQEKLQFENNPSTQSRILAYFAKSGLSPSALNKFVTCPLDFYFRYVLKYREEDDVEESVEHSTFGSVVHDVLEKLYTPFISEDKALEANHVRAMLKQYEAAVDQSFRNNFETDEAHFNSGDMYFASVAAKKQIKRFLLQELAFLVENPNIPLFILGLEESLKHEVEIEVNGKIEKILLNGTIDRIDRVGQKIRIIDYKTGSCKKEHVTIAGKYTALIAEKANFSNADFDVADFGDFNTKYATQLLFYLVLFYNKYQVLPDEIGIHSLRNVSLGLQTLKFTSRKGVNGQIDIPINEKLVHFTESYIRYIAEKILVTENFEHEPKAKYCLLCK